METFFKFFDPVVQNKYFSSISGFISLLNPFAMLPQLWSCIVLDKIVGVSAPMYVLFALMQVVFALVAIKARNILMFISMVASIVISISIVIITLIKI